MPDQPGFAIPNDVDVPVVGKVGAARTNLRG